MTIARPGAPGAPVRTVVKLALAVALVLGGCLVIRAVLMREAHRQEAYAFIRAAGRGYSNRDLAELMVGSDPGAMAIAAGHDPDAPEAVWARPPGWKRLDVDTPPTLGLDHLSMGEAKQINGVMPNSQFASPPAAPFVLHAGAAEREQAVGCLTAAIYYEAALEPLEGQEAVAQVVINRMRHPGFPKSICGVVFQGSDRPGCQFSFACDGSMARPPAAWAWKADRRVAEHALNGFVMREVGGATHYHTNWVVAAWTPTLIKVGQIGQHIFFRPTGPSGQPSAFNAVYQGGEAKASKLDLMGQPSAATAAPTAMMRISQPGSVAFGRVHGVVGADGGLRAGIYRMDRSPMHAMIAMRAAAARAALAARGRPYSGCRGRDPRRSCGAS